MCEGIPKYIWSIPAQIDLAVILTILDFFPRYMLKGFPKKYRTRNFRFFYLFLMSISPKITQKTENDTVGRYRFRSNLDSKFYVRKQTF